jgi:hypothetical protein
MMLSYNLFHKNFSHRHTYYDKIIINKNKEYIYNIKIYFIIYIGIA